MKITLLSFGLLLTLNVFAQSKSKIIPVDKSILKLSEDTAERIQPKKIPNNVDYVIVINTDTNKKDTILVYNDIYIDRKRKPKN